MSLNKIIIVAAAISAAAISIGFSANTAHAQDGPEGFTTLSGLGCGSGHVARVNAAGAWECSPDLTDTEAAAAAAQATADNAAAAAVAAQSAADSAAADATAALSTANVAAATAAAAQSVADSASADAAAALSTADAAAAAVAAAQSAADSAAVDAAAAQSTADAAAAAAAAAQSAADSAIADAAVALLTANDAAAAAAAAQSVADSASADAASAQLTADNALAAAGAAQLTATDASDRVGVLEGQNLDGRLSVLEAGSDPVLVDCNIPGETITAAIADGATDITVRGLCNENLNIRTSNVTIRGETLVGGDPVDGIDTGVGPGYGIRVRGAQNVSLIDLKITGGRNAVNLDRGAVGFINNSELAPAITSGLGVFVGDQSYVALLDSNVTDGGILASRSGVLRLQATTVTADAGGNTSLIALNLFATSVANVFGGSLDGRVLVNSNSVLQVRSSFLGINFGPTVVDSSSLFPITCLSFSNITQTAGSLVDVALVPLTAADVLVGDIAVGVPGCTLNGL